MNYSPLTYAGIGIFLVVLMLFFTMTQTNNSSPVRGTVHTPQEDTDMGEIHSSIVSSSSDTTEEHADTETRGTSDEMIAQGESATDPTQKEPVMPVEQEGKSIAFLAGGCFWCVESDMEKIPAVYDAVSGYMGGTTENPTYENYSKGGHREVVKVIYDPSVTSYADLVRHLLRHIDPTDGEGSFGDRGEQYAPAVYYTTEEEREIAESIIHELDESGRFDAALQVPVLPAGVFYKAEDYHQEYSDEHKIKYTFYRSASGRDRFIDAHWSEEEREEFERIQNLNPEDPSVLAEVEGDWREYKKPSTDTLQEMLSPISYEVTQEDGTEKPFENEYWDNTEEGIYVDILSGEPLFSSIHKYKSGTGWPSFTEPIYTDAVTEHEDKKLFTTRTEIRSVYADSHLGHVFNDGPKEQGGLRYCMNSAALRFIPKDELEGTQYEPYLQLFEQ